MKFPLTIAALLAAPAASAGALLPQLDPAEPVFIEAAPMPEPLMICRSGVTWNPTLPAWACGGSPHDGAEDRGQGGGFGGGSSPSEGPSDGGGNDSCRTD